MTPNTPTTGEEAMSDKPKAELGYLPSGSGDGYGFGGGVIIMFAKRAIVIGEGSECHRIAEHIVAAINAFDPFKPVDEVEF